MTNTEYLTRFFDEKEIAHETWTIENDGCAHIIGSEAVIELIHGAPDSEQASIVTVLRKLDFHNAPIEPFLKHLAEAFVKVQGNPF